MERRKSRASLDPSGAVKAAAWAWFQRGSLSDGKPIDEFHATRSRHAHAPIPSRYKLEALRMFEEDPEKEPSSLSSPSSPSNQSHTSLFDTYEIERISEQLDYLVKASTNLYKGGSGSNLKKEKKKNLIGGFWARHAIVCGTKDDVLETVRIRRRAIGKASGSD